MNARGRLYRFVFDPGSPYTAFSDSVIQERGLPSTPGEYVPLHYCVHPTGSGMPITRRTPKVRSDSLFIRGLPGRAPAGVFISMPWVVRLDWFDIPGIDGVLGMNSFHWASGVFLDLSANRIEFRW